MIAIQLSTTITTQMSKQKNTAVAVRSNIKMNVLRMMGKKPNEEVPIGNQIFVRRVFPLILVGKHRS